MGWIRVYGNLFLTKPRNQSSENTALILAAYSSKDTAGTNIAKQVLNNFPFSKTDETFQEKPVYSAEIRKEHPHAIFSKAIIYLQLTPTLYVRN